MQKIDLASRVGLFRGVVSPLVRMNDELLNFYNDCEARVVRARSASGVRLAFVTDAVEMTLAYTFGGACRQIFATDLVINGENTLLEGEGPHTVTMEKGEKQIIIHLPHLMVVEKMELSVNDGAFLREMPSEKKKKLLICGDSIMQGMTCTSPRKAVGTMLAELADCEFHNTSVGGADMRPEAVESTLALGGDAIVVGFGINDAFHNTDAELFRERTVKVLELLDNFAGKSFIVVPIPNMKVEQELRERYCRIIREEQKAFPGVTLIEGADFFPADDEFFADGTHPNDKGMKVYAEALAAVMAPALA